MPAAVDISIIITLHREGDLSRATLQSTRAAKAYAQAAGLSVETIAVLDCADGPTAAIAAEVLGQEARFVEAQAGDPGQARNRGIETAQGRFSTFMDGDDLWSENWLTQAYATATRDPNAIYHCACIMRFGQERHLYWHVDSDTQLFDPKYHEWANYWDAMSFGETAIYKKFPFHPNDLERGFGHEDWHWNTWTITNGLAHKPVPETLHFKRSRPGSQMSKVEQANGVPWPT